MTKINERISLRDVCIALYIQRFNGKTDGFELLRWPEFRDAVLRAGVIGTIQTARAKWCKLATIPEVFCFQADGNIVAVDVKNLHSMIQTDTHRAEEVIRW